MKKILIVLGLIFLGIYGYGKYQDYERYHSEAIEYSSDKAINENHYDQQLVLNYRKAIEDVNGFVKLKWFANGIDVLKPEKDNLEAETAVRVYGDKISLVKFYEEKLIESNTLKEKGLSPEEMKAVFENKKNPSQIVKEEQKNLLRSLFERSNISNNRANGEIVYEIQKLLVSKGYEILIDGKYRQETQQAIKEFEEKNNLFPDGKIDLLVFEKLLD